VFLCRFARLTGTVFVADETPLAASFPVAYARLVNLTRGSSLVSAAEDAYGADHREGDHARRSSPGLH
jgi:hypothetical protein